MQGRSFEDEASLKSAFYQSQGYFSYRQWINYGAQVNAIQSINPASVLEIGVGNKIVSGVLKHLGYSVVTYDINENLNPDYAGNILDIDKTFGENSFDCILCAEVLEHLPFAHFEECIEKLASVSRNTVVLTLPSTGRGLHCAVGVPLFAFDFMIRLPFWFVPKEHHWEIDNRWKTRMANILDIMSKYFTVSEYYRTPGERKIYVFILKNRKPVPLAAKA